MRSSLAFLAFFFFFCTSLAFAQPNSHWTQLSLPINFPEAQPTPYFLNEAVGFIYNKYTYSIIFRTTDAGKSWKNVFPDTTFIYNISFGTISHGFIASSKGLYETTDTGATWIFIDSAHYTSVYANITKVFSIKSDNTGSQKLIVSRDYNKTNFDTVLLFNRYVSPSILLGNKDSLIIVIDQNDSIWCSTNNGIQWERNDIGKNFPDIRYNLYGGIIYGVHCSPHCNDILLVYLPNGTQPNTLDDVYKIIHSSDYGKTWQKYSIDSIGGWIAGAKCNLYVSYSPEIEVLPRSGLLRSEDGGNNWKFVPGPEFNEIDDIDFQNLSVVGHGAVVYAVTPDYNAFNPVVANMPPTLWVTRDGGDGTLSPNSAMIKVGNAFGQDLPKSIELSLCDSTILTLTASNICEFIKLENISLSGLDSSEFSISKSESYQCGNYAGKFRITIKPHKFTNKNLNFHLTYSDDEYNVYDTTVFIQMKMDSSIVNHLSFLSQIVFDTLSTCAAPRDTTITFINSGCDTLTITQGPGNIAPEFTMVTNLNLPRKIAPGDSIKIIFRFTPSGTGTFSTNPVFHAEQQGLGQDIKLYLEGSGKSEGGVVTYYPKAFTFKSLSICDHDSASGFIANVGCDSLHVDPAQILGDTDYRVSGVGYRVSVGAGDTINYKVYMNPAAKGLRQGMLVLTSHGAVSETDSIPFTCTVHDGTKILSSSVKTLDFGMVPVCDAVRDTSLKLINTGCDTVRVSGAGFRGSGFGTGSDFPIILLPGHDTTIDIYSLLDTAGGKTISLDTITFSNDADTISPIKPIPLSLSYSQSGHSAASFYLDTIVRSGIDQSIVIYDIKENPAQPISGLGVKQLSFGLNYNTDLLQFDQSNSSKNLSFDGKNFTIADTSGLSANKGVIASIAFKVFLTKDSSTDIVMTSHTDTTAIPCGILTVTSGGSARFNYTYLCGDHSIQNYMNGILPFKIISLHPNPAQDEIEIDVNSAAKQEALVEIRNALGAKVASANTSMISGVNSIRLDTKNLSDGVYVVRIGNASETFVKVR